VGGATREEIGVAIGEAVRRSSAVAVAGAGVAVTTSIAAVTAVMPAPAMRRWNDMVLRFCVNGGRSRRAASRDVRRA
jgi:hypothetical protein